MSIDLLAMVTREDAARYHQGLSKHSDIRVRIVNDIADLNDSLRDSHTDVLVIDNQFERAHHVLYDLRQSYPRLLTILVDEEVDFAMPGHADEVTTDPFNNDDLVRRVRRMMSDRQMETVRSDTMPAVRNVAKRMRSAVGLLAKQQAGVLSCKEMGYDYVAYYHLTTSQPLLLSMKAQEGPAVITSIAPKETTADDLISWVFQNGQCRIAAPEDRPNYPLVARGRLGAAACVPATFNGITYGVIVACRDRPNSITQENVMMLELVASQMAAAMAQDLRR